MLSDGVVHVVGAVHMRGVTGAVAAVDAEVVNEYFFHHVCVTIIGHVCVVGQERGYCWE